MYLVHWPSQFWEPSVWEVEVIGKVAGNLLIPKAETMEDLPYTVLFHRLVWTCSGKQHLPPPVDVPFLYCARFYFDLVDAFEYVRELKFKYTSKALKSLAVAKDSFDRASKTLSEKERVADELRSIKIPLQV